MKKTIGELRNKENLTQIEMAKILGISVSAYNMYENGNRKVPEQIASKIAQILKVNTNTKSKYGRYFFTCYFYN